MKKYEQKEVVSFEQVLFETTCDICKREIAVNSDCYEVETGHNDWGNDSYESMKELDICSEECLKKEFNIYLEFNSDTKYINIEKC